MKYTSAPIPVSDAVTHELLFAGCTGQDGAIYGDMLFRFDSDGSCRVFSLKTQRRISEFTLDKIDVLKPHCNCVSFGSVGCAPGDEFPLIYCNVYNNYAKAADRLEGMCCVYRLTRSAEGFAAKLVQVIKIGFVNDLELWKSIPGNGDVRPYGNLVADPISDRLYAFTMRDAERVTRVFEFRLPRPGAGEYSPEWDANVVTLNKGCILSMFDTEYTNYMQGACAYAGRIYSVEGFSIKTPAEPNRPALRVIDVPAKRQLAHVELCKAGLNIEPELIDFEGDTLYYMDASGAVRIFEFVQDTNDIRVMCV